MDLYYTLITIIIVLNDFIRRATKSTGAQAPVRKNHDNHLRYLCLSLVIFNNQSFIMPWMQTCDAREKALIFHRCNACTNTQKHTLRSDAVTQSTVNRMGGQNLLDLLLFIMAAFQCFIWKMWTKESSISFYMRFFFVSTELTLLSTRKW